MSIILKYGSLFASEAKVLINPVNCVGTMGKGLAKMFAECYPEIILPYQKACQSKELMPGKVQLIGPIGIERKYVVNFPTKYHWRYPSKLEYIQTGLTDLTRVVKGYELIAMPALGCGYGQLNFAQVAQLVVESGIGEITDVELYLPQ